MQKRQNMRHEMWSRFEAEIGRDFEALPYQTNAKMPFWQKFFRQRRGKGGTALHRRLLLFFIGPRSDHSLPMSVTD